LLNDHLLGWISVVGYGKTVSENSIPVCNSSIWRFLLYYYEDCKQVLKDYQAFTT